MRKRWKVDAKQPLEGNWIAYYWIAYYSTYNGKPAVLKIRVGTNHQPELVTYASDLNPCGGRRGAIGSPGTTATSWLWRVRMANRSGSSARSNG